MEVRVNAYLLSPSHLAGAVMRKHPACKKLQNRHEKKITLHKEININCSLIARDSQVMNYLESSLSVLDIYIYRHSILITFC